MEAIILSRILEPAELEEVITELRQGNCMLFYFGDLQSGLNPDAAIRLEKNNEEKKKINYEIMDRVLAFGEIDLDGLALADAFTFEKAHVWHYQKFRTYFLVRNLWYELSVILDLARKHEKVTWYTDHHELVNFKELPALIRCRFAAVVNKPGPNYASMVNYLVFFILRVISGLFRMRNIRGRKHLIIDHSEKQTCLNIQTLKEEQDNYNLVYLFDTMGDDFLILDDVEIPKFSGSKKFRLQSYHFRDAKGRKRINGETLFFMYLFDFSARRHRQQADNWLGNQAELLKRKDLDLTDSLIRFYFLSLVRQSRFFLFKYCVYRQFFNKHSFSTVSTIDENSPRIKSILDAAKFNGIKTAGIQHGTLHELHPAYMYTVQDQLRNIVPDFTLVWGEKWKHLLAVKGHYRDDSLVICGHIRTDIIPLLKRSIKPLSAQGSEGKKIVMFASQPQQDPELRWQAAKDVFEAILEEEDIFLVVKLHPNEKQDLALYRELAVKAGLKHFLILYYYDLYVLIAQSHAVITCFSSVGSEAVYFSKPLIILDHLNQDIQGYIREGIAIRATSSTELKYLLNELLSGKLHTDTIACKSYIERNAFKTDGKVAERIRRFLLNLG